MFVEQRWFVLMVFMLVFVGVLGYVGVGCCLSILAGVDVSSYLMLKVSV